MCTLYPFKVKFEICHEFENSCYCMSNVIISSFMTEDRSGRSLTVIS